jgi:hypothetical protein
MIEIRRVYVDAASELDSRIGCGWRRLLVWSTEDGTRVNVLYWPVLAHVTMSRMQWAILRPGQAEEFDREKMRERLTSRRDNLAALSVPFDRDAAEAAIQTLSLAILAAANPARARVRTRTPTTPPVPVLSDPVVPPHGTGAVAPIDVPAPSSGVHSGQPARARTRHRA